MSGFGKNKVRLWESTLEKLGRILSEEYGIKVTFKYDVCATTGKQIFLPVIPEGARQEFLDAIQGYLDHEVSHILFTDFDVVERCQLDKGKKHFMILNALEDARCEARMIEDWRGCKVNLNNCHEWSLPQLKERWDELSEFGKTVQGICALANSGEDHWFTKDVVKPDTDTWDRVLAVRQYCDDAKEMKSTQECYEAAQKIMEILSEDDEPVPEDEVEGKEGEEGEGKGEKKKCKPGQGSGNCKPLSGDESDEDLDNDMQIMSDQDRIREEAKEDTYKYRNVEDRYLIYTTEGDTIENVTSGDRMKCAEFLNNSRSITNTIRAKFRRSLLSQTKCKWVGEKRRGSINPSSLHRVALGTSKSVFRSRVQAESFDTCVSMYVDHSGSMFPYRMDLAAECSVIFGECLNDLSIPFEICGFSTMPYMIGNRRYEQASDEEKALFTRWGDLWIGVYKKFEDNWPSVRHRCVEMSRNDHDNTYDGEGLRFAAQRLLRRPEKRKILFWLNDGYPCPNVHWVRQQHHSYLKGVAKEVEKLIEVFAIGMQSDGVKEYFKNWVQVSELGDLSKVVVSELDRLLRSNKRKVA